MIENTRELRKHLASGGIAAFDLSERAQFRLTGADRVRYLNGQVSNDVRRLAAGERDATLPACILTAKGKMNALVWIGAGAEELRVDAEAELREPLAARLERYIISDDVTLTDLTGEQGLLHLVRLSSDALGELVNKLPVGVQASRAWRFGLEGIDLVGPPGELAAGVDSSSLAILRVDAATAETFRIEQGIPRWGAELTGDTLPAEAGLDAFAIDFHKGCYIGQEVISRIKSVGHVNRRLCGFVAAESLTSLTSLVPGAPLFADGKEAGVLTSAAWSFALDKAVALGYLKRGITATAVSLLQAGPAVLEIRELPLIP